MQPDHHGVSEKVTRKRTFDVAFISSAETIANKVAPSVVPIVAPVARWLAWGLSSVSAGLQSSLVAATGFLNNVATEYQAQQPPTTTVVRKTRARRTNETEAQRSERHRRKLERRRLRAAAHHQDAFLERLDTVQAKSRSEDVPTKQATIRVLYNHKSAFESLKARYRRTIAASRKSSRVARRPFENNTASPLHRSLLHTTSDAKTSKPRTLRDATTILNQLTPHKARISKSKPSAGHTFPITKNLANYLESPAQNSPQQEYRSPGRPLPSPVSSFNPFKTKYGRTNAFRSDSESLEDLIKQLHRDHPHQYEWERIFAERAKRDAEIAKLRASVNRRPRAPIPIATAKTVEKALHGHLDSSFKLVEKFNQEITVKDLATLRHSEWLNDEVINFFMNLLIERSRLTPDGLKLHAFNTFFYTKLSSGGYKDVRRWAKKAKVDIASLDLVLVPVHLGVHWCMAAINLKRERFEYWDSLPGSPGHVFDHLRDYMANEAPSVAIDSWTDWVPDNRPQQRNGYDCGVFACQTAESISQGLMPQFTQDDMQELRKRIAANIVDAKVY